MKCFLIVLMLLISVTSFAEDRLAWGVTGIMGGAPIAGGGSCDGTQNFVGTPGATESFANGANAFCTSQFSITGNNVSSYSTFYAHDDTHGAYFNDNTSDGASRITATLPADEDSYQITFWAKSPDNEKGNTSIFYMASNSSNILNTGYWTSVLAWRTSNPPHIVMYSYYSGDSDGWSLNTAKNTVYKLVLKITRNASSTCDIYASDGTTLVGTLTVTNPDRPARYFYWISTGDGDTYGPNPYGVDSIVYSSANP
jgi:hypothetical protein